MARINADPHREKYVFEPSKAVTAFFEPGERLGQMLNALEQSGFGEDEVDVFVGANGASTLDFSGEHHGRWVRLLRELERVFADQVDVYDEANEILRSGGSLVAVFTEGDDAKKTRAAELLKNHGGREVLYWGTWTLDRLA